MHTKLCREEGESPLQSPLISTIVVRHLETGALVSAFDVEAFVCLGAVKNRLSDCQCGSVDVTWVRTL